MLGMVEEEALVQAVLSNISSTSSSPIPRIVAQWTGGLRTERTLKIGLKPGISYCSLPRRCRHTTTQRSALPACSLE